MKHTVLKVSAAAIVLLVGIIIMSTGSRGAPHTAHAFTPCPSSTDPFFTTYNLNTVAEVVVEVTAPAAMADMLTLSGPITVATSDADGNVGTIETEIVAMTLTGHSPVFGDVRLLQSATPSCGQIATNAAAPTFPAASFFDVFYRIDVTQPFPASVSNAAPLTVNSTIRAIPPYGEAYYFTGQNSFVGGSVSGQVTMVKHIAYPEQRPSWSIDSTGPSSTTLGGPFHPADILHIPASVGVTAVGVTCAGLGMAIAPLPAAACGPAGTNNVDGLSYGSDFTGAYETGYLGFSVSSPGAGAGVPGTDLAAEALCAPPEAASDEFGTILNGKNYQIYDGDGVACDFNFAPALMGAGGQPDPEPAAPPLDDLDALEDLDTSSVDLNGDTDVLDATDKAVYFTLTPGSAALAAWPGGANGGGVGGPGASAADVLVCNAPAGGCGAIGPRVYAQEVTLGLKPSDVIDAICLREGGANPVGYDFPGTDYLFFSLAPGSPSLTSGVIFDAYDGVASPADIIYAYTPGRLTVVDPDALLGLTPAGDVDALKCLKGLLDVEPVGFPPGVIQGYPGGTPVIEPLGYTPPPTPVQYVGTQVLYSLREDKRYTAAPIAPPEIFEQMFWVIGDSPGSITGAWGYQAGDACFENGVQEVCELGPNPGITQDQLVFNQPLQPGITTVSRFFGLTCDSVGLQNVTVALVQFPLGQNDLSIAPRHLTFSFQVDCQPAPCTGPNFDATAIGNGRFGGAATVDDSVPNADADVDACDADDDNDNLPDLYDTDPSGDDTYDDDNDGRPACLGGDSSGLCGDFPGEKMCLAPLGSPPFAGDDDGSDDGPSWDIDCDGIRDGYSPSYCATLSGDADGDGIPARAEVCKWGTSDNDTDSDGDGYTDCLELVDVDGDNAKSFLNDLLPWAKAIQLAGPAWGKDGDYDYNGDNMLTFLGDLLPAAKAIQFAPPVLGGCAVLPGPPNP
jgi:hypothetical protein